mgnify:CR=1 FL=1
MHDRLVVRRLPVRTGRAGRAERVQGQHAPAPRPPTWTLYDTHYTERYLGLDPDVYYRNGIVQDAPKLERPLMLIHGFADDNVTIAHSLRLSQALMAAGRPHTFLPLTGITHMTNDETVAETCSPSSAISCATRWPDKSITRASHPRCSTGKAPRGAPHPFPP